MKIEELDSLISNWNCVPSSINVDGEDVVVIEEGEWKETMDLLTSVRKRMEK